MIRPSRPVPSTWSGARPRSAMSFFAEGASSTSRFAAGAGARSAAAAPAAATGAEAGGRRAGAAAGDAAELAAGLDGGAGLGVDLGERAGGGGGDLDGDLVGLELAEHLVLGHGVAQLLEPGGDGRLADALAEGRDHDLDRALVGGRRLGVHRRRLAGGLGGGCAPASAALSRLGLRLLVDGGEERVDAHGLALPWRRSRRGRRRPWTGPRRSPCRSRARRASRRP